MPIYNDKHLEILKRGVEVWNEWRKKNPDVIPDLSGAYLIEYDLSGFDFSHTVFIEANLTGANLKNTNFNQAVLRKTILPNALESGANYTNADLDGAIFIKKNQIDNNEVSTSSSDLSIPSSDIKKINNNSDSNSDFYNYQQTQESIKDPSSEYIIGLLSLLISIVIIEFSVHSNTNWPLVIGFGFLGNGFYRMSSSVYSKIDDSRDDSRYVVGIISIVLGCAFLAYSENVASTIWTKLAGFTCGGFGLMKLGIDDWFEKK